MAPAPQQILLGNPVQVFWVPYDPLDLARGSLDPLGFARGYVAPNARRLLLTATPFQIHRDELLCRHPQSDTPSSLPFG